jgi:hypothetical protein
MDRLNPLPSIVIEVDRRLLEISEAFDWLTAVSPTNTEDAWSRFHATDFTAAPTFEYSPLPADAKSLRQRLRRVAVDDVEHSVAHVLLSEKQRELDRLLELIALRGKPGFLQASIDLFGGAESELFLVAKQILAETAGRPA